MPTATAVDPCDFVIFGGTGDLAVRKLLPALYLRDRDGQLTADTRIIAVARAGLDEPGYRHKIQAELGRFVVAELLDTYTVDRFLARLRFVSIDLTEPADYVAVTDLLSAATVDIRVFYLACAPALFGPIRDALDRQGLVTASSRVVLEKPIGHDLASAQAINDAVGAVFEERQIFRIDHYLGKESVQNLLVTRFANTLLEPLTAKEPGPGGIRMRPVSLALNYTQAFQRRSPDAYERLLMDVVRGDPTLFMRRDEVEAAWSWAEPILRQWQDSGRMPRTYPAGTDGPVDAATLLERDGRRWHEGAA